MFLENIMNAIIYAESEGGGGEPDLSWMNNGGDSGLFTPVVNAVEDLGASMVAALVAIGLVGFVLIVLIIALMIMLGGSSGLQAGKRNTVFALLGIMLILCIGGIASVVIKLGSSINQSLMEQQVDTNTESKVLMDTDEIRVTIS